MPYRSPQHYYYSDSYFQLELNLQEIRRALIYLLEESENYECFLCNRLRCRCEESFSTIRSYSLSDPGYSFSEISSSSSLGSDYIFITAPPAEALPMPVWQVAKSHRSTPEVENFEKDIEKWVRASTPNEEWKGKFVIDESINSEVNLSWPPVPASIWYQPVPHYGDVELPETPPPMEPLDPVEAFFRHFAEVSETRGYSYF